MITQMNKSTITPELEAEFLAAVQQAMTSKRDPEAMRRAAERMDRAPKRPIVNTDFLISASRPSVSSGAIFLNEICPRFVCGLQMGGS